MEYSSVIIGLAAFVASMLTFFSGFGLGTLLMPVFAIFFPTKTAIALTAIVHLGNNIFKYMLTHKHLHRETCLKFGLPAIPAAFAGAYISQKLGNEITLAQFQIADHTVFIYLWNFIIGILILFFVLWDAFPHMIQNQKRTSEFLTGGLLSGFFGGLSGHQGALRSLYLINKGMSKEAFIATGIAIACLVDIVRLPIYFFSGHFYLGYQYSTVLIIATLAAIAGAVIGNYFLKKTTIAIIQKIVTIFLIFISLFIILGLGH